MAKARRDLRSARLGADDTELLAPAGGPAAQHQMRHLRVELQTVRGGPDADRLVLEGLSDRQKLGAADMLEALAVPVIDMARPGHHASPGLGRLDRPVAD